ncbi:MAG: hypothetical protein CVV27_12820 [Candidatus Melainabacteria bacterium HGW-Melainabacteria-1]|nr:MAG: hypothetical protein CVV27_12820 [Candidatus Melainabacteria bacterium HGW-Melainabacteria-1]
MSNVSSVATPLTVGLVEFTEPMEHMMYLPYSLGLLQSYVLAHAADPARYLFLMPICKREPLAQMAGKLSLAQVVAFSTYVWNIRHSLALAMRLKAANPKLLIVFGGPQVPERAESWLRAHPYVDVAVHGEGEVPFLKLLESLPQSPDQISWSEIPGLSWIDRDGSYHNTPKGPPVADLDTIPSPYLSGFYEPLMLAMPEQKWVAVWETNRGCPFSCTFCDWGVIQSKVRRFGQERVRAEIDWFGRHKIDFLYCSDANFGMLPRDPEIASWMVETKQRTGYPRTALMQMTKNQADRAFDAFKILADARMLRAATLSMQSLTPAVLSAIKRDNISLVAYQELLRRFVNAGIPTYTDMLIGLPGESFESFLASIDGVITQGQHEDLRFWNSYLLPNAEMAAPEYRARYGIESVEIPCLPPFVPATPPPEGIVETLEMVIATATMPRSDWVRLRALAWLTQILYYGKLLQLPLLLLHALAGIRHADLLRAFLEDPLPPNSPIWAQLRSFLSHQAQEISQGKPEFVLTPDQASGIPIWMPVQSFALTLLLYSDKRDAIFAESKQVLTTLIARLDSHLPPGLLDEALELAHCLFLAHLPAHRAFNLTLSYNLWDCYQRILKNLNPELRQGIYLLSHAPDGRGGFAVQETAYASL